MALGFEVTQANLNMKAAQTVLQLRSAFEQVESITKWLANHPKVGTSDPLVTTFEYTADEAYALRLYFETMDSIRTSNAPTFDVGRKMTGLE